MTLFILWVFLDKQVKKQMIMKHIVWIMCLWLLASCSEGGPNWRGYTLDSKNSCCKFLGIPDIDCSGNYKQC